MDNLTDDTALTALRQDLKLERGIRERDGSPTWTLIDPVQNRYFKLAWRTFMILSYWLDSACHNVGMLKQALQSKERMEVDNAEIGSVIEFFHKNNLTESPPSTGWDYYLQQYKTRKQSWYKWLIHNYLFVRIPLIRPTGFLQWSYPYVQWAYSPKVIIPLLVLGFVGVYLTVRQWDQFITTAFGFFTLEGIAGYLLALVALKILHEFGHAYTATRYGCKVSTMGMAFLVLFPVLYTDVSDAWRLNSRSKRIHISASGMLVELSIALLATFAWSILPDGILRNIVFFMAAVSWVSSLAVNVNPFMRFDGYYLMSDLAQVDNLQQHSFQHARAELRYRLFGVERDGLNYLYMPIHKRLVFFAWATWIYRFFLFLGIALLVYGVFFKVLGIILFIVEIVWFILLPIGRELKAWYGYRKEIMDNKRSYITFLILGLFILACIMPWSTRVAVPAVMEVENSHVVYSSHAGEIQQVYVKEGDAVEEGTPLLLLESNELRLQEQRAKENLDTIEQRLRRTPTDERERSDYQILLSERERILIELQGLTESTERLLIKAPQAGTLFDMEESLLPGRWINIDLALLTIVDGNGLHVKGFVEEKEINRIDIDQIGHFYPKDVTQPATEVRVDKILNAGAEYIDIPYLSARLGGELAVRSDTDRNDVPDSAVYGLILVPTDPSASLNQVQQGTVVVKAKNESPILYYSKYALSVLIREFGGI